MHASAENSGGGQGGWSEEEVEKSGGGGEGPTGEDVQNKGEGVGSDPFDSWCVFGIPRPPPVPLPFFSFTGWKNSFYGDLHAYGKQAVRFYTETKTITARWFEDDIPSGPNMTISLK